MDSAEEMEVDNSLSWRASPMDVSSAPSASSQPPLANDEASLLCSQLARLHKNDVAATMDDVRKLARVIEIDYSKAARENFKDSRYYTGQQEFFTQLLEDSSLGRVGYCTEMGENWMMFVCSKLIAAVIYMDRHEVRNGTLDTVCHILQKLSTKSSYMFLVHMITFLKELSDVNMQLSKTKLGHHLVHICERLCPMVIQSAKTPTAHTVPVVEITNLEQCERLQAWLCSLLFRCMGLVRNRIRTESIPLQYLVPTLLKQLELGDLSLKAATLHVLQQLLACDLCPRSFLRFVVDHMLSLTEWFNEHGNSSDSYLVVAALVGCMSEWGQKLIDVETVDPQSNLALLTVPELVMSEKRILNEFCNPPKKFWSLNSSVRDGAMCMLRGISNVATVFDDPGKLLSLTRLSLDTLFNVVKENPPCSEQLISPLTTVVQSLISLEVDKLAKDQIGIGRLKTLVKEFADSFSEPTDVEAGVESLMVMVKSMVGILHWGRITPKERATVKDLLCFIGNILTSTEAGLVQALKTICMQPVVDYNCVASVLQLAGALTVSTVCSVEHTRETLLYFTGILSAPWYSLELKRQVASFPVWRELEDLSKSVPALHCYEAKKLSLRYLSALPKDIKPDLRKHFFILALNSTDKGVAEFGSWYLSTWIAISAQQPSPIGLVKDNLMPFFARSEQDTITNAFLSMANSICAVSGCIKIGLNDSLEPRGTCEVCEKKQRIEKQRKLAYDKSIVQNVLLFLNRPSDRLLSNIKRGITRHLLSIINHMDFSMNREEFNRLVEASFCLIADKSFAVRESYCDCLEALAGVGFESEVSSKLQKALAALRPEDSGENLESALNYLSALAGNSEGEVLKVCMVKLFLLAVFDGGDIDVCRSHITTAATAQGLSLHQLYKQHYHMLCEHWVRRVSEELEVVEEEMDAEDIVKEASRRTANLFGFSQVKEWVRVSLKRLIPHLALAHSTTASVIHKHLTELAEKSSYNTILENFQYILVEIVVRGVKDTDVIWRFVVEEGGKGNPRPWGMGEYLSWSGVKCQQELMLHLWGHKDQVLQTVKDVTGVSPSENSDVMELVRPRFLPILTQFQQLFLEEEPVEEKLEAVRSLSMLFEMVGGSTLDDVRFKALAVLRATSSCEELQETAIGAWTKFCQNVLSISSLLVQLLTSIIPLLSVKGVDGLLQCIFRHRIGDIRQDKDMKDLCFLLRKSDRLSPCPPGMVSIEMYLPPEMGLLDEPSEMFRVCLRQLKHEQHYVKKVVLQKLKSVLQKKNYRSKIQSLIINTNQLDPVVSDLVVALMETIHSCSDREVSLLVAECMGELGAIDPGRLGLQLSAPSYPGRAPKNRRPAPAHFAEFGEESCNVKFATIMLNRMGRALLAADSPNSHDLCSLSIQNILKVMKTINLSQTRESAYTDIWNSLNPAVRNLLTPLLESKFAAKTTESKDILSLKRPIFRGTHGMTFSQWIYHWLLCSCKQIENRVASQLFIASSTWAELDSNFAHFLLPHVVLQGLLEGKDATFSTETRVEVFAVLSAAEYGGVDPEFRKLTLKTVFFILDTLRRWVIQNSEIEALEIEVRRVKSFLEEVAVEKMATAAEASQSHTRALMYYETLFANKYTDAKFTKLQELYSGLGDSDGVAGSLAHIRDLREPSSEEWILAYSSTGDYTAALPYHEIRANDSGRTDAQLSHIKCLLKLNQPQLAYNYMSGLSDRDLLNKEEETQLLALKAEAAWKLQNWDALETILPAESSEMSRSWNVTLGSLLVGVKGERWGEVEEKLTLARQTLASSIVASTLESGTYENAYPSICKLHILAEIEEASLDLVGINSEGDRTYLEKAKQLIQQWEYRSKIIQTTPYALEPVMEVRRHLLSFFRLNKVTEGFKQRCWLKSATVARKAGHLQTSWGFLVKAKKDCPTVDLPEVFMEEAKYYKEKGALEEAIRTLRKGMEKHFEGLIQDSSSASPKVPDEHRFAFTQAQVLLAGYTREANALTGEEILELYQKAVNTYKSWEQLFYLVACFVETLLENQAKELPDNLKFRGGLVLQLLTLYGRCQELGSRYLHHSMPRILTLWLDFGQEVEDMGLLKPKGKSRGTPSRQSFEEEAEAKKKLEYFTKANLSVRSLFKKLPKFQFYSAFSQLVSRISHPVEEVYKLLEQMIVELTVCFPEQCLWLSVGIYRSAAASSGRGTRMSRSAPNLKQQRVTRIQTLAGQKSEKVAQMIQNITLLADQFMALADYKSDSNKLSMEHTFPQLFNFFQSRPKDLIIPLQSLMEFTKLQPVALEGESMMMTQEQQGVVVTSPASCDAIFMEGFEDSVEILRSLAKPKKLTMRGSDGELYSMLCKPQDDMRKDKRLMEFVMVVNACLGQDSEARRRELHVRTYTVVPLGEDGGLVEWVPNLAPLRVLMNNMSIKKGRGPLPDAKETLLYRFQHSDSVDKVLALHRKLLRKLPDLFMDQCIRELFPESCGWYSARLAFTRTAAVMSMVGFVLGLGDRHSENILMDTTCGDVFHVDFDLLFNKGEFLPFPERVPFRLTRNMVDAFGPLGVEGAYRRACEVALTVLRENKQMLMTVLDTFLHDPLVEWTKQPTRSQQCSQGLALGDKGTNALTPAMRIELIEKRLSGFNVTATSVLEARRHPKRTFTTTLQNFSLSPEGQAGKLIDQATSEENLAHMYIGWAPYL